MREGLSELAHADGHITNKCQDEKGCKRMGLEYTLVRGWRLGAEKRASHERGWMGPRQGGL